MLKRPHYSLAALLLAVAVIGVGLAIYRYFNPPPVYPLPSARSLGPPEYFYAFGHNYSTTFSEEEIAATPAWDRHNSNPPISAEEAIVRADRVRKRLIAEKKFEPGEWLLTSAELRPYDGERGLWWWLIRYFYEQSGPPNEILLAVLMDGTVIEPIFRNIHDPQ